MNIDIGLSCFKVVNVCCTYLSHFFGVTWYQVSKLRIDLEGRRCGSIDPWHFVNEQGQPLHFRLPIRIHAPHSICQRLATCINFGRDWTFVQVHNGTANRKVLIKLILQVRTE